jgi:CDP-paratose 2-epimerase
VGVQHNLDWLKAKYGKNLSFVEGDVRDFDSILRVIQNVDVIFHLAAQVAVTTSVSNPTEDFSINAQGTLNVLEAARRQEPMPVVLYTSTNKVYGGLEHLDVVERSSRYEFENLPQGVAESCPLDFHSPYGCSKGSADQYVHDYYRIYGLPTIVFRMSCIYGPHQFGNEDQGWVAHFCITGMRGGHLTIYGDGKQVRDLLYVDELVELMLRACKNIERIAGQVFNVGGGPANTISVWTEFRDVLRPLIDNLPSMNFDEFRPGDQKIYVSDIRKAKTELGWAPRVGIAEGLQMLISSWKMDGQNSRS